MPASPVSPPPSYPTSAGRGGSGCLWGCLFALFLLFFPAILAGGYGGWILLEGYRRDPVFRLARELVRRDGTIQRVMGHDVMVKELKGSLFSWMPGFGRQSFDVGLQGERGQGDLMVSGHEGFAGPRLDSAILTAPDGRRYDLLRHKQMLRPDKWI